jgi:hypothetical protein
LAPERIQALDVLVPAGRNPDRHGASPPNPQSAESFV